MVYIKKKREACGMTSTQLAQAVGVTPAAVTFWENGTNTPAGDKLPLLAAALGCTINDLFTEDKEGQDDGA